MDTESIEKRISLAKIITSVGVLLFVVPMGLVIVSYVVGQGQQPIKQLLTMGWAFWVTFWLLPLGLACLVGGLSWIMVLRRSLTAAQIADEDAEERAAKK